MFEICDYFMQKLKEKIAKPTNCVNRISKKKATLLGMQEIVNRDAAPLSIWNEWNVADSSIDSFSCYNYAVTCLQRFIFCTWEIILHLSIKLLYKLYFFYSDIKKKSPLIKINFLRRMTAKGVEEKLEKHLVKLPLNKIQKLEKKV